MNVVRTYFFFGIISWLVFAPAANAQVYIGELTTPLKNNNNRYEYVLQNTGKSPLISLTMHFSGPAQNVRAPVGWSVSVTQVLNHTTVVWSAGSDEFQIQSWDNLNGFGFESPLDTGRISYFVDDANLKKISGSIAGPAVAPSDK